MEIELGTFSAVDSDMQGRISEVVAFVTPNLGQLVEVIS